MEFHKKPDGTALAVVTFFKEFQKDTEGGCEDLIPNQYVTYSCVGKALITDHQVIFTPELPNLKFTADEDSDENMLNIVVTKKPLSN